MTRRIVLLIACVATLTLAWSATARASSLFQGTNADLWLVDAETGRITAINVDVGGWLTSFTGPGGPLYPLAPGEAGLVNALAGSSVPMTSGQPSVSLIGLGDPAGDGGAPGQNRLDVTPATGTYDGTISVKLRVSTQLLGVAGYELRWTVTGGPGPVSLMLGPAELGRPDAEIQGGYLVAYTLHLVRDGATTIDATLRDPGGSVIGTTSRTYTISSSHPDGFRRDTDGDGVPDLVEAEIGLDPLDEDWTKDSDLDGWSDFDEWLRRYCLDASHVPDPSAGFACLDAAGNPLDGDGDGWADFDEKLRRTRFDDPPATLVPEPGETATSRSYLERLKALKDYPAARRLYEVERVVTPGSPLPDAGPVAALAIDQANDQPLGASVPDGIVQSFVPAADNLAGIDVKLAGGDTAFDDLTLLVWTDPLRGSSPIVRARLRDVSTSAGGIAAFRFPPVPLTPGQVHYIEILAEEASLATTVIPGIYAAGAVIEASGLTSGPLPDGGQADLWFRTYADTTWDGFSGGRPAGTEWTRVTAASASGAIFHAPEQLLDPADISGAGLTFADVADRKEAAVHAAALSAGEWPAMRLPAGSGTVVAAELRVAGDSDASAEAVYKGWLGALRDVTPKRWFDEMGVGTWNDPGEWRIAFVAYLDARLATDETIAVTEDDAIGVALLEAALAEEARLRGAAPSVLFAHAVDRRLVEGVSLDLKTFPGGGQRLGDVVSTLEAASSAAGPIEDLADLARLALRAPQPDSRSDAAFSALLQRSYDPGCFVSAVALADLRTTPRALSSYAALCPDWVDETERAARDAADAERRHRLRMWLLPGAEAEIATDATLLDAAVDSDADGRDNGLEIGHPLAAVTLPWNADTDGDGFADDVDDCPRDFFDRCGDSPRLPDAMAGADVLVSEPEAGSGIVIISVGLERSYDEPVTLQYRAVASGNDTATPGVDFDDAMGQVTIRPGERVVLITVRVYQDGLSEGQETFHIELVSADHAVIIGDGEVQVAIDDTAGNGVAPNAVLVASAIDVAERAQATLSAAPSNDPGGEELRFSWRQVDTGAPLVTLNGAESPVLSFVAPAVLMNTELEFEVTVRNLSGLSDVAVATVQVLAYNDPPVVTGTPRFQVAADQTLAITDAELLTYVTDPENDPLTVGAIHEPPGFGSLQDTGSGFVYTPGPPPPVLEVDVENVNGPNGGYAEMVLQSFVPHRDNIAGLDAYHYGIGGSVGDVTMKIWNNAFRIGSPLYEESRADVPRSTGSSLLEYRFEPIPVVAGVPLYVEFITQMSMGISLSPTQFDFYPEGAIVERGGAQPPAGHADLYFRTYSDPGFGQPQPIVALSQPEITGFDWLVNGTHDTVLLHEFGAALDAPGTVRTMAVDLATRKRSLVLEKEPWDLRTTPGHPAIWFRTDAGTMVHRYDPTANPKLVSVASPTLLAEQVSTLRYTAVDPRSGDLHYCERDPDVENDKHWYRLSHADGSLTSTGLTCPRFADISEALKIGRRTCLAMDDGGLFCTDIDGAELQGVYGFPSAFTEPPYPEGGTSVLGFQQVGDAALYFVVARDALSIPTALQVRLLQEEFPPDEEPPPGPGPLPEPSDPSGYFPLLLELTDVRIEEMPEVAVLPDGAVVIAIGEQPGLSAGSDQVLLYHWSGDPTDLSMTHLNAGAVVPTAYGRAGKLATSGGRLLWQIQDVFEDPTRRNIFEIAQTPGASPPFDLVATVDGIENDDAPLDLFDLGGDFFAALQDPIPVGTNACTLTIFPPDGAPIPVETYFHCTSHQELPGRGSLFEIMEGQRNLMLFSFFSGVGLGETTFSVEIDDDGGKRAILPVTIEVVAP